MKNKSWLGFLASIIGTWFVSVSVIILIKHWCIGLPWYDSRISLSNALSLGSAIGAIAVAVFAWLAYKYATKQYLVQKKIDHGIDGIKRIMGLMFLHKTRISSPLIEINLLLVEGEMVKNNGGVDGDGHITSGLINKLKNIEHLVNDFTNDWAATIGPELTLLTTIIDCDELTQQKEYVQLQIYMIGNLIKTTNATSVLSNINCEQLSLDNAIVKFHNCLRNLLSEILNNKLINNDTQNNNS